MTTLFFHYLVIFEGSVDLLYVGKDDLGIEPARRNHVVHVVARYEIWDSGKAPEGQTEDTHRVKSRLGLTALLLHIRGEGVNILV